MTSGTRTLTAAAVAALVLLAGCVGAGSPSLGAAAGNGDANTNALAAAAATDASPSVTVDGSASVEAAPDLAVVRVAVEATADSAEAARASVAADTERMRAALREAGLSDDAVSTQSFAVHPQYDYSRDARELVGYRAVHAYRIEVAPERAGEVVDVATGNGATSVAGIAFTLSDETRQELRQEALSAAVENARADAETVASAAGTSLDGVRSISTSHGGGVYPVAYAEARAGDGASTVVEPGTVSVTASVTVVYDLA